MAKLREFAFAIHKSRHGEAAEELANYANVDDIEEGDEDDDTDMARNVQCCRGEMSKGDRDAAEAFADGVKKAQFEVIQQTEADDEGRRRKKRASRVTREADALSCQDIMDMADQTVLESSHVIAMTDEEFASCIDIFGSGNHMTETRKAILDRIREEVGNGEMCKVSQQTLKDLGSVAQALTAADIDCLENFDGVNSLGGYSGYSEEQLMKFAMKYIMTYNKASSAALTASDIGNMGHFVCGLTAQQIEAPPSIETGRPAGYRTEQRSHSEPRHRNIRGLYSRYVAETRTEHKGWLLRGLGGAGG